MRLFLFVFLALTLFPLEARTQTAPSEPVLPLVGSVVSTDGLLCRTEEAARVIAEAFTVGGVDAAYAMADAQVDNKQCRYGSLFYRAEVTNMFSSHWHDETTMTVYRGELLGYQQGVIVFLLFTAPGT